MGTEQNMLIELDKADSVDSTISYPILAFLLQ